MTFRCPACGEIRPLAEGQLIIAQPERPKRMKGRYNLAERVVSIFCTPCTADLVLVRAGVRT